jgi:hypothetical protein
MVCAVLSPMKTIALKRSRIMQISGVEYHLYVQPSCCK